MKFYMIMLQCWWKISERNLEQQINIKFVVKLDKSISLVKYVLWQICYEEIWCSWVAQIDNGRARRCTQWHKKWVAKNTKNRCKCGQCVNINVLSLKIKFMTNRRRTEYESRDSVADSNRIWEWEKLPQRLHLESWLMTRNNIGFTFHLLFLNNVEMFDMVTTGNKMWCFQYHLEIKIFNWAENSMHVLLAI